MTGLISPSLQAQLGARVVVEQPALALVRPRIPVVSGPRLIEMAGLERGLALLAAPNAKPVVVDFTPLFFSPPRIFSHMQSEWKIEQHDGSLRPRRRNQWRVVYTGSDEQRARQKFYELSQAPRPAAIQLLRPDGTLDSIVSRNLPLNAR